MLTRIAFEHINIIYIQAECLMLAMYGGQIGLSSSLDLLLFFHNVEGKKRLYSATISAKTLSDIVHILVQGCT